MTFPTTTSSSVPREQALRAIMSGETRGFRAGALRLAMGAAEPFYASAARFRNYLFDEELKESHHLSRPVISVGNITTGGTGKTPVVEFLARHLRDSGRHVCILSRGYKSTGRLGDEQLMLEAALNTSVHNPVRLIANPNRVAAATAALRDDAAIDLFLLDDGFQHRAVRRDLDIVLINAREPFGFQHVLPRGLLREPLIALRRADAFVITHADQVSSDSLSTIDATLRSFRPDAAIYQCAHVHAGLSRDLAPQKAHFSISIDELSRRRFFLFCGIGDPQSLHAQISAFGAQYLGHHFFPDHHHFTSSDIDRVKAEALAAGAELLVTTAKDWVKIPPASHDDAIPIWRLDLAVRFLGEREGQLIRHVENAIRDSSRHQAT